MANYFEDIYTKETLGFPMTPSRWMGEPTYTEVTDIMLTAGGGMGGMSWHEYVLRTPLTDLTDGKPIALKRWEDGEDILINPRYIVKARQLTICSATYYTDNPSFSKDGHVKTINVLTKDGHEIVLVNEFDERR